MGATFLICEPVGDVKLILDKEFIALGDNNFPCMIFLDCRLCENAIVIRDWIAGFEGWFEKIINQLNPPPKPMLIVIIKPIMSSNILFSDIKLNSDIDWVETEDLIQDPVTLHAKELQKIMKEISQPDDDWRRRIENYDNEGGYGS